MSFEYGERLRIALSGSSHGEAVSACIAGFPAGEPVDLDDVQNFLRRRSPGRFPWQSARKEPDDFVIRSGIVNGVADGAPIVADIPNRDVSRADYDALRGIPRPGHADFPAYCRYGLDVDLSGGGAFSARMTAPLCFAGALCKQYLERRGVRIGAHIAVIGGIEDAAFNPCDIPSETLFSAAEKELPVLDDTAGQKMLAAIGRTAAEGDSLGGSVECAVTGLPAGFGNIGFDSLESHLAQALFMIPAVKAVEFGAGTTAAHLTGNENNDAYYYGGDAVRTRTNRCGGILGGLSTGMPLLLRASFKPTPSIAKRQHTVDLNTHTDTEISISGRHDPCVVPRAVPCVEAAAAIVLADLWISTESNGVDLSTLRVQIDGIDDEIARLFGRRMAVVQTIRAAKRASGLPVRDETREAAVLARTGALLPEALRPAAAELFGTLFALSRKLQEEE